MASINFGSTAGSRPYATLTVNVQSQDISNNRTVVAYNLVLHRPSRISSSASKKVSVTINGVTGNSTCTIGGSGDKSIMSGTRTIAHNSDGSKSISFSASVGLDITWSGSHIGTISGSGSMTLPTIARGSSYGSISGNTIGSPITVNISRQSSSFTHHIFYHLPNQGWKNIATHTATSATFTIPLSECSYLASSTSGTLSLLIETYNGSTFIAPAFKNITVYVPSGVVPSVSAINVSEATANISAQFGGYVKDKSTLNVSIGESGAYGSWITSRTTTIQGVNYSPQSFKSNVITASGNVTISTRVADSRGRSASRSTSINVLDYYSPRAKSFNVQRCNSDGSLNDEGVYAKITGVFDIAPVNSRNTRTVKFEWNNGGTWTTLATFNDVYSGTKTHITTQTFTASKSFEFRMTVADYFAQVTSTQTLKTASAIMSFGDKGVAFGKVYEKPDIAEFEYLAEFRNGFKGSWKDEGDFRNDNTKPSDYVRNIRFRGLKASSAIGLGSWGGTYVYLLGLRGWGDNSGGGTHELAFGSDGFIYIRKATSETAWSGWKWLVTNDYLNWGSISGKPNLLRGVNANGYWGMASPDGGVGSFIRTTQGGIIPYQSGGHGALGTHGWPFAEAWINKLQYGDGSARICDNNTNNIYLESDKGYLAFYSVGKAVYADLRYVDANWSAGSFYPSTSTKNGTALGQTNSRWYRLYSANACNTSSDRRLKDNIVYFTDVPQKYGNTADRQASGNIFEDFFFKLKPSTFTTLDDSFNRIKFGYIAQDVIQALNDVGLTAYDVDFVSHGRDEKGKIDENAMYSLCYEEFIALNTHMIQQAYKKLDEQQITIINQQKEIDDLKKQVQELKNLVLNTTTPK